MSNPPPQEPTLTLSIPGERDPVPVRGALDPEGTRYDSLLAAPRWDKPRVQTLMYDMKSPSYYASKISEVSIRFSDNESTIFVRGFLVDTVNKVSDHVRQMKTIPKTGWQAIKHTWESLASECVAYPTIEMREKVFAATLTAFSTDEYFEKSVIFNSVSNE